MKKFIITNDALRGYVHEICRQITNSGWRPNYVVGITRGGLIPAVMISHYFEVPMYTLKVTLRDGDEADCETNCWMAEDALGYVQTELRDIYQSRWDPSLRKNILIVDDINDTGATIEWIKRDWEAGCLPNERLAWNSVWNHNVRFAEIVNNLASKYCSDMDFVGVEINKAENDVWVEFPYETWWK